jgi:hypothetical protein
MTKVEMAGPKSTAAGRLFYREGDKVFMGMTDLARNHRDTY